MTPSAIFLPEKTTTAPNVGTSLTPSATFLPEKTTSTHEDEDERSFFRRKCCPQYHTSAPNYSRCFDYPSCGEPQHIASHVGPRKLKRQRPSKARRPIRSTSRSSSRGSRRSARNAYPSRRPPRLPPMLIRFDTLTPPRDGGGSRIKTRTMHHQTPFRTTSQSTQESLKCEGQAWREEDDFDMGQVC